MVFSHSFVIALPFTLGTADAHVQDAPLAKIRYAMTSIMVRTNTGCDDIREKRLFL